ncbi:MAG TPA: hypothetical protein VFQ20_07320 [Burkholderiaceae bacterium]|nr:hypothetical protein [Burkholderiaceae bacterium]
MALIAEEVPRISVACRRGALLYALALCGLVVGSVLAGVAALLWAVTPTLPLHAPWLLVAVPVAPLLAGLVCALAARSGRARAAMDTLREQVRADIAVLREAAAVS